MRPARFIRHSQATRLQTPRGKRRKDKRCASLIVRPHDDCDVLDPDDDEQRSEDQRRRLPGTGTHPVMFRDRWLPTTGSRHEPGSGAPRAGAS